MISMKKNTTLQIAVPTPIRKFFDYLPPLQGDIQSLAIGARIRVPFQRREVIGIFMGFNEKPTVPIKKLKHAIDIIDKEPVITEDILKLCQWAADYYHYPIGEVVANALPVLLRQGKPAVSSQKKNTSQTTALPKCTFELNQAQKEAIITIQSSEGFNAFLLHGVTGSGKTEVYLQVMEHLLKTGKQVLVLIPEIGLTPQTIQRFSDRFREPLVALHSGLTHRERLNAWIAAKTNEAKIIIGTRSAIFTPFPDLGLIIVDEEHDLSFKQQDGFRYHARDLAILRASTHQIPIILGSATPALETLHKALSGKFKHLSLPHRAGGAKLPQFKIVDIRNKKLEEGLSEPLLLEIKEHLERSEQVMLFLNRRGFAPVLMCHACGWMVSCSRCDMRMTYHKFTQRLICHHCDSQKKVVTQCATCNGENLQAIGMGTERLETVLERYFSKFSIARIDRDSTQRKGSMEKLLNGIQEGEHQILIGTQMLAKGHHFPNVTLVAIVDADAGLFSSDFRSLERMGQLLLQVSGRAGRMEKEGKVILQTHQPDHPLLHQLFKDNYQQFAESILNERLEAALPPYSYFALFRAEGYNIDEATRFLQAVKKFIHPSGKSMQVLGPIPAPMAKRAGRHRVQLLLQSKHRSELQTCLKNLLVEVDQIPGKHRIRWSVDVDPVEMF